SRVTPFAVAPPLSVPVHAAAHAAEYSDSVWRAGLPKHCPLRGRRTAGNVATPAGCWPPGVAGPVDAAPAVAEEPRPRLLSSTWSFWGGAFGSSCPLDGGGVGGGRRAVGRIHARTPTAREK